MDVPQGREVGGEDQPARRASLPILGGRDTLPGSPRSPGADCRNGRGWQVPFTLQACGEDPDWKVPSSHACGVREVEHVPR